MKPKVDGLAQVRFAWVTKLSSEVALYVSTLY